MQFGKLTFNPVKDNPDLVAPSIQERIHAGAFQDGVLVSAIDPNLADTAAFCQAYDIAPEVGANCIIVEARRADRTWYAACLVLASNMIDVNNKVRRYLDARKISFASKETALELTGMEYGGITPLGLPKDMPILIDEDMLAEDYVIVGSGVRNSKLLVQPKVITDLDQAKVIDIKK